MTNYNNDNKIRLSRIEGGNKHNAIPREAFAVALVPKDDENKFKKFVKKFNDIVKAENSTSEPGLVVSLTSQTLPKFMID